MMETQDKLLDEPIMLIRRAIKITDDLLRTTEATLPNEFENDFLRRLREAAEQRRFDLLRLSGQLERGSHEITWRQAAGELEAAAVANGMAFAVAFTARPAGRGV